MKKVYWRPTRVPRVILIVLSLIAVAGIFSIENFKIKKKQPYYEQKIRAANTMKKGMEVIRSHHGSPVPVFPLSISTRLKILQRPMDFQSVLRLCLMWVGGMFSPSWNTTAIWQPRTFLYYCLFYTCFCGWISVTAFLVPAEPLPPPNNRNPWFNGNMGPCCFFHDKGRGGWIMNGISAWVAFLGFGFDGETAVRRGVLSVKGSIILSHCMPVCGI